MTSEHSEAQPTDEARPEPSAAPTGGADAAAPRRAGTTDVPDWEPWPQRPPTRGRLNRMAVVTLVFGLLGGVLAPVTAVFALRRIRREGERGKALVTAGLVLLGGWVLAGLVAWGVTATGTDPDTGLRGLRVGDCFRVPTGATASRTAPEQVTRVGCDAPHNAEYVDDFPAYERSADERYPGAAVLSQRAETLCRQRQRSYVVDPLGLPAEVRLSWYLPTRVDWSTDPTITCYLTSPTQLSRPLRMDGTVLDPAQLGYLLASRDWTEARAALVAGGSTSTPATLRDAVRRAEATHTDMWFRLRREPWPEAVRPAMERLLTEMEQDEPAWRDADGEPDRGRLLQIVAQAGQHPDPATELAVRQALRLPTAQGEPMR
ncbi:septum formation family protein [Micromonospora sp. NPDC049081]|uniref:septum formation family protein n=1 Tax=Micromonospora sp. NPDC049081 TaxID=3155150 RepID=UPI0033EB858C